MSEIENIDSKLEKQLMGQFLNRPKNKRSDIDSRLMELQAKIDLLKMYKNMPAGHGRFDFEKIGKRSYLDPVNYIKFMEDSRRK